MKDLIIIGAGGFAREVAWLVEEINLVSPTWNLLGFYDEKGHLDKELNHYRLFGSDDIDKNKNSYCVIAIGDSEARKNVAERYAKEFKFATLIHPDISISNTNIIGQGTIICKGTILTVNINIGEHVIINLDCTIGHDSVINDFVTILPSVNISGGVKLGECSNIGTGTQIIQYISIGEHTIIGAGSVVVKNILDNVVAVGIPAKEIKKRGAIE